MAKTNTTLENIFEALEQWDQENLDFIKANIDKQIFAVNVVKVASSGMSRKMRVWLLKDGKLDDISELVSHVTKRKYDMDGNIVVKGCGMNMVFKLLDDFIKALDTDESFKQTCVNNYYLL